MKALPKLLYFIAFGIMGGTLIFWMWKLVHKENPFMLVNNTLGSMGAISALCLAAARYIGKKNQNESE